MALVTGGIVAPRRSKIKTRGELIDAAFDELTDCSLDGLSIRQLTAAAGITPAAFYRHFADIDEVSLVLVDAALGELTSAIRNGLRHLDENNATEVISSVGASLIEAVENARPQMIFIARERYSGRAVARRAIQDGLRIMVVEVAAALRAKTRARDLVWEDCLLFADIFVQVGIHLIERLISLPPKSPRQEEAVRDFYKQAFLLMFGGDAFIAMVPPGTPLPDCEFDKDSFMPTARMSCENSAPD